MRWTIILLVSSWPIQTDRNLMYQDAEVLSRLEICFIRVKWEATVVQFCNLEMEGLQWLWEYIKLITLDIPIRIASSWATEILDNTSLKKTFKVKQNIFLSSNAGLKKKLNVLSFITESKNFATQARQNLEYLILINILSW